MRLYPIVTALLAFAASAIPAIAAPTFPPGSGVGLEPPPGMSVAKGFSGFQRGLASIVVIELPAAAYAEVNKERGVVTKKIDGAKIEDFSANGVKGFIARGTQSLGSRVFRKWGVVLGAPQATALVTAQVPMDDTDITDAAIETALRTIVFRDRPDSAEAIAALPFKVGDTAGFRPDGALMGATVGFTEGPKDVDPGYTQPRVIVSTSLNHPPPEHMDRLDFAVAALKSISYLSAVDVRSARLVDTNGAQWAEVTASAHSRTNGIPLDVFWYLRFGADSGFIIVTATQRSGAGYADRFRRLALSVVPKD